MNTIILAVTAGGVLLAMILRRPRGLGTKPRPSADELAKEEYEHVTRAQNY